MGFSSLVKQLKKRLRRRSRLSLGFWLLLIGVAIAAAGILQNNHRDASTRDGDQIPEVMSASTNPIQIDSFINELKKDNIMREVAVRKVYVCGEEMQALGELNADDILKIHYKHPQWAVNLTEGKVVFSEQVDDLSPKCKENAYFGLDQEGNLSLFDGLPIKNNVIRTFFQLNIEHLESSLPRETLNSLYEGIRITDYAEFNSVLSTFSDFAVEETEKVMKPTP